MAKDDPREMESAHEWLATASRILDLDEEVIRRLARPLLDLTREVAHNRSRPAAPLTAFLVGLAASSEGAADEIADDAKARIDALLHHLAETSEKDA